MFLIPAVGAFTADTVVIYLYTKYHYLLENFGAFWSIKNISYLLPLAILRQLLLIPYNYHTYSGTRLKIPAAYSTIHALSAIVVFAHFLAFSLHAQQGIHNQNDIIVTTHTHTVRNDGSINGSTSTSSSSTSTTIANSIDTNVNIDDMDADDVNTTLISSLLNIELEHSEIHEKAITGAMDDEDYFMNNYNPNETSSEVSATSTSTSTLVESASTPSTSASTVATPRTEHKNDNFDEVYADSDSDETTTFDLIMILLTLSLCSISLHIIILLHVRSSAPSSEVIRRKFEEGQCQSSRWSGAGANASANAGASTMNGGTSATNRKGSGNGIRNNSNHNSGTYDRKRKMLAYWVYDRYRRENDVEPFEGLDEGVFSNTLFKRNAVGQLSPIQSKEQYPRFALYADSSSISDDGDLSQHEYDDNSSNYNSPDDNIDNGLLSSDCDEYFDASERFESKKMDHDDDDDISYEDNMHYFAANQAQDDFNTFESPQSTRRRNLKTNQDARSTSASSSTSWRNRHAGSFRGLVDIHSCLSKQGYDDFLSEIRSRFQEAKREWDSRLQEVSHRMRQNENSNNPGNFLLQKLQHTPFRALLHLYAHEDVFLNQKLDRAFSMQNQSALSFYAPQLLCFLLHNAYLSTGRLEKWILDKCKTDTQFAHQCFWFLRAWCLQGGIYRPEDDHYDDILTATESHDTAYSEKKEGSRPPSRNSSIHSFAEVRGLVAHPSEQDLRKTSGIKLSPEERHAVENLLSKIIECGELSTRKNHFGGEYDNSDSNDIEAQPVESSPLHCTDAVNTNGRFSDAGYLAPPSHNHSLGLMPKTLSSIRLSETGEEIQSYFLRTPDFLDTIMGIADDLFLEQRSNRTPELRRRLVELEANMLPSKSIYVPVNGSLHHICRIVSSESFAISTKERVPCIIYLEVIDHDRSPEQRFTNEDDVLNKWYKSSRPPQRHNTIFAKVSRNLKKLRHELEENQMFRDSSRDETLPLYTDSELGESTDLLTTPSSVVFKETWETKVQRIRLNSAFSSHPNWRLLPILVKTNDDIRQEQLAAQMIHCMATILSRAKVPVWLYPYDIVALSFRGGIMEAIPDTISIDSLRKKHPDFTDLKTFFQEQFGEPGSDAYENAKANFVESLAAYSILCFLLQIKDRHNGNIMLDNKGHLVHIDFGFYFLSSPGKNSGFESAPFKLTRDFVELMDGANSHSFMKFRELCYRTFLELRRNCFQITLLVQMLIEGNEDLDCFRNRPHEAVEGLQERFQLELNDKACVEYVNSLINDSLENWTTTCYDKYQRCCVGIM